VRGMKFGGCRAVGVRQEYPAHRSARHHPVSALDGPFEVPITHRRPRRASPASHAYTCAVCNTEVRVMFTSRCEVTQASRASGVRRPPSRAAPAICRAPAIATSRRWQWQRRCQPYGAGCHERPLKGVGAVATLARGARRHHCHVAIFCHQARWQRPGGPRQGSPHPRRDPPVSPKFSQSAYGREAHLCRSPTPVRGGARGVRWRHSEVDWREACTRSLRRLTFVYTP
jgi:hypothetical protein